MQLKTSFPEKLVTKTVALKRINGDKLFITLVFRQICTVTNRTGNNQNYKHVAVMILSIIFRKNEMPLQLCDHTSADVHAMRMEVEHKVASAEEAKSDRQKKMIKREPTGTFFSSTVCSKFHQTLGEVAVNFTTSAFIFYNLFCAGSLYSSCHRGALWKDLRIYLQFEK